MMIAARRLRAHLALFSALLGVVALLSGLGIGIVGLLDSAALDGVRGGIAELRGSQAELRFDAPKSADPAAQDRRAREIIAEALRQDGASVPVIVTRVDGSDGADSVWTIHAAAARVRPVDLPVLATAKTRIRDAMLADPVVNERGVAVSGHLDEQARALATRIAPLSAIEPVPLLLVAAIGVVALAELARLLDGVRMRETALLRSRGASAARVGLTTSAEAAIVGGVGALLGGGIATGILLASGEHALSAPLAVALAGGVVAVTVALVGGAAYRSARTAFRRDTSDDSGRARRLAAPGLLVLLTAAAIVSMWRFLQFGSPLAPSSTGAQVDPIAVLAPALGLADIAVLWLALFPLAARAVEAVAARRDGLDGVLVARQLARRARLIASPVVLIALAGGGLVVAGCYTPSWQLASARTDGLRAGADLVIAGASAGDVPAITKTPGVRAAAPVVQFGWTTDAGDPVDLAALGVRGIREVVSPAAGVLDRQALARELTTPIIGARLPDAATGLALAASWSGQKPGLTASVVDEDGVVATLQLTLDASGHASAALPAGTGRRLIGLEASLVTPDESQFDFDSNDGTAPIAPEPDSVSLTVSSIATTDAAGASTPVPNPAPWAAIATDSSGDTPDGFLGAGTIGYTGQLGGVPGFDETSGQPITVRLQPRGSQLVPVAVSSAFASAASAQLGQKLELRLDSGPGGTLTAKVAAIVPELPGASGEESVLAPLAALQAQRVRAGYDTPLTVTGVWASSDEPAAAAARLAAALPRSVITGPGIGPGARVLAAVPPALWIGMAGGSVLALIALAAVAGELLRLRADEVAVLRALGLTRGRLARLRRRELASAAGAALVGAAVAGVVVSALTVPGLVFTTLDRPFDGLPPVLRADPLGLAIAGVALAVAITAIVAVYGRRVAGQARTAVTKETVG